MSEESKRTFASVMQDAEIVSKALAETNSLEEALHAFQRGQELLTKAEEIVRDAEKTVVSMQEGHHNVAEEQDGSFSQCLNEAESLLGQLTRCADADDALSIYSKATARLARASKIMKAAEGSLRRFEADGMPTASE